MTEPAARPARRGLPVAVAVVLAIGLAALVLLAALYAARRQIAREAITDWLRSRGIASQSEFEELGPGRLVGRVRIGSPTAPDLTIERAEVRYSLARLLAGRGVEVTSIRLVRPVLRARWQGGRFAAGSLDPLIEEFRKRPPQPGAPSPRVEIDQGLLLLATDYGPVRATADALVDNGKLIRLDLASAPMRAKAGGLQADLGASVLQVRAVGDGLDARLHAPFAGLGAPQGGVRNGALTLTARTSYPDPARTLAAAGQATVELSAADARMGAASTGALRLTASSSSLRWTRAGGDRLTGDLRLAGDLHGVAAADLRLASAAGEFRGEFTAGKATSLRLTGSAEGRGAWTGLGPPVKGDSPEIVAVKRGLRAFRVSAQGIGLATDGAALRPSLSGPVRLQTEGGGEVRLAPRGAGYRLTSAGGGLPKVEANAGRLSVAGGAATTRGSVKAALSIGPLQDAVLDASGSLRIAGGAASFTAGRCLELKAARFDLGQNAAERISGRLCPTRGPLLRVDKTGWVIAGRVEQAAAAAPFLQARVEDGGGPVKLSQSGARLSADLTIDNARVIDALPAERFRPLAMSGRLGLARDLWAGVLDFRPPKGPPIAHAVLRHHDLTGVGSVEVATGSLKFTAGGLQPAELSPVAAQMGSAAEGSVEFAGGFRWTPSSATSGGRLNITGLDFRSPAGAVSGLSGQIEFTSLAPLIAPPGQVLHVRRIAAALPLTDATASIELQEKALVVAAGQASAGGGVVRIEHLEVPLEKGPAIQGLVQVEGVQLHDLVEASPFGDRVELDAKVSGRIPFEAQDGKVHVARGELRAIAPGRLSISRAALTSVSAQGSVEAPAQAAPQIGSTDTFTDFAYQALENLAFDKLEAGLDTRSDGRLGVLFHIVGRHDPPQHQEISISWLDLIRRKFLGKKLPLPSGTGVDLTLDTTLNLDDLLKDYADFERLRSSPTVQP